MKKEQKTTRTGSSGSTKSTSTTSSSSPRKKTLEEEAKEFKATKRKSSPGRPAMTPRVYLAGQAMNALLVRHTGSLVDRERLKEEAYDLADFMLE